MATPINTPLTAEIWHLSIDDLLTAPMPTKPRLGGPGPFVINLSASTAPISQPLKGIGACPSAHVYQIQRIEDRRLRYRLRLGPFASEDEADAILDEVRDMYPSALTATAEADDLRAISAMQARIDALRRPEKAAAKAPPPDVVQVTPPPMPALAPVLCDPVEPVLTAAAVSTAPRNAAPAVSAAPLKPPAPPPHMAPAAAVAPAVTAAVAVAPTPAFVPRHVEQLSTRLSSLESTQTVRPLTPLELESDAAASWFVIQLAVAEESFDPHTLPNLDIFSEYRLYSVAGFDQGRVMHALRLGFFGEAIAAGAVASYLAAFYENPTVKRVSAAERERFADRRVEARKDVGATGRHAVIEITSERVVRENRTTSVTVLPIPPKHYAGKGMAARKK